MKGTDEDPRGLIQEAYRIEGITEPQCRSIFLDWALGVPDERETRDEVRRLLNRYSAGREDHPMTRVLQDALDVAAPARRRGGRRARISDG